MGCGRVGARLAHLFEHEGHAVTVIDLRAESFARLGPQFRGSTLAGTGIDEDVLKSAGIQEADIFLAMTNQDNANIMAAQIAQLTFQVPRVIARIYEPDRDETFHQMGLETVCPTLLVSNRVYEAVQTGIDAHIAGVQPARPAPAGEEALLGVGADETPPANGKEHAAHDRPPGHLAHSLRQRFFR